MYGLLNANLYDLNTNLFNFFFRLSLRRFNMDGGMWFEEKSYDFLVYIELLVDANFDGL